MAAHTKRNPLRTWRGPERPYDLIAEGTIAVIFVALLVILASSLWASPNGGLTYPGAPKSPAGQAFSARYWDVNDPSDLAATAVQELAGGTTTAGTARRSTRPPGPRSRSSGSSRPRSPRRSSD